MTVKGRHPVPAEYGETVAWRLAPLSVNRSGTGTFVLAWLGIEEVWDVRLDNGDTIHLHPALGDTMTPLCEHDSATGIDQAPNGPDKIWRCDVCGWLHRSVPDDRYGPGVTKDVPATIPPAILEGRQDQRSPECVERWPDCVDGAYNPACCRFPKSCSCGPVMSRARDSDVEAGS